jgi:hypothetical protein
MELAHHTNCWMIRSKERILSFSTKIVTNFLFTFVQYFGVLFLITNFLLCVAGLVSLKLYVVFLLVVPLLLHALYRLVNPATKK